jgi:hypothetical protein
VQLLRVPPQWKRKVWQCLEYWEKVEKRGHGLSSHHGELLEALDGVRKWSWAFRKHLSYRVELLKLGVINARCTESEYHLGRKRVGIATDVIDEKIRVFQETDEHGLVLQVLVRHICLRSLDVEVVVYYLPYHAPGIAIFLAQLARQAGAEESINHGSLP